jgi:hypothetical protein
MCLVLQATKAEFLNAMKVCGLSLSALSIYTSCTDALKVARVIKKAAVMQLASSGADCYMCGNHAQAPLQKLKRYSCMIQLYRIRCIGHIYPVRQ